MSKMSPFFEFELEFVDSLRCIPMQVRLKLDTCGVKLKLTQWSKFNQAERQELVDRPCATPEEVKSYRDWLQALILQRTGAIATELAIALNPPWLDETIIPEMIHQKATELGINLTLEQWQSLTPLQRFALIKLSQSGHENSNFLPALKEFKIA